MTQLGYVYESEKKTVLLMITLIFDDYNNKNDKICDIKYIIQQYPKSDTFTVKTQDFRKTSSWKQIKAQRPNFIFEEKFNDYI